MTASVQVAQAGGSSIESRRARTCVNLGQVVATSTWMEPSFGFAALKNVPFGSGPQ
jgi:hypothetical protein